MKLQAVAVKSLKYFGKRERVMAQVTSKYVNAEECEHIASEECTSLVWLKTKFNRQLDRFYLMLTGHKNDTDDVRDAVKCINEALRLRGSGEYEIEIELFENVLRSEDQIYELLDEISS